MAEKEVRLIDANALKEQAFADTETGEGIVYVEDIDEAPTIDPESLRPKGKWRLNDDGSGTCLRCCRITAACWDYDNALPYCPNCGAKMEVQT